MGYLETLERIHSLNKFGSRPGLDRINMLLEKMENPQNELRFIHVAGTNGKGSVCALVSSVLRCAGYKTGLFISPYITSFCERIQINNEMIPEEKLTEVADYVFSLTDELNAQGIIITEFEFVMAVAFEYFKRENCDVVVLEVGLGGRLDSTNVIKAPLCSVITKIGLDHTDILGETIKDIAREKGGIIKKGTRVVSSPQTAEARGVFEEICKEKNVPLRFSDALEIKVKSTTLSGTEFEYRGENIRLPLLGEHQVENLKTALCALEEVSSALDKIDINAIKEGVESAHNPARFEIVGEDPCVIIDGAHNPDGMSTFAESIKKYAGDKKGVLVIGMLADKDSRTSLKYIGGLFGKAYTVPVDNPRAMKTQEMAELCKEYFEDVTAFEDATDALVAAYKDAKDTGVHLCVCGSLYLASQIRPVALKLCKE